MMRMMTLLRQRRALARLNRYAERQLARNDCGISAVKTALNLCGKDVARHAIRDAIALDEEGSNFDALKAYLQQQKIDCSYKVLELAELDEDTLAPLLPCIAMVSNAHYNHYIVIHSIAGDQVTIMDPAEGRFALKDVQYLNDRLVRIATAANPELSFAFIESYVQRQFLAMRIARRWDGDRNAIVMNYNKLRYFEWLRSQVRFGSEDEARSFLDELLACADDSIVPSRFKTFRMSDQQLSVKSPVVLSFRPVEGQAPVVGESAHDPVLRLLQAMLQRPTLRRNLFQLILVGTCVSMVTFLTVYANQILIDEVIPTRELGTLYAFIAVLFFFRAFELAQNVVNSLIEVRLSRLLDRWLCRDYNEAIVYASGEALASHSRGELTQRVNDMLRIKGVITNYVTNYMFNIITVVFAMLMTLYQSIPVATVVVAVSAAYALILHKAVDLLKMLESKRFTEKGALVNALINLVEGHGVIAKNGSEAVFIEDQQRKLDRFLDVQQKSMLASQLLVYIPRFIAVVGSLSVILITTRAHIIDNTLSLGQIFTLLSLSELAFMSLRIMLRTKLNLQEQGVVIDRFFEIRELEQRAMPVPDPSPIRQLVLHQLHYSYPGRQFSIDIPALALAAGDRVLLQGTNGSGKSTLLKILAGVARKGLQGDVVFYSDDQLPLGREAGFAKVSLVRAEDKIFNDTIQFNITFSHAKGGKHIYKYAQMVGADDFISPLSHPIDSLVHDQGANLSTGQKRKLLVLRALLSRADVIILDEIFRGIDAESKRAIARTLNALPKEKIVIYTTHEHIDELQITRVIELEEGRLRVQPVAAGVQEAA